MFNTIKSKVPHPTTIGRHINRHRGKYAAAATFLVMAKLQHASSEQWKAFLVEKGIDPMEFFIPEYYEELQQAV